MARRPADYTAQLQADNERRKQRDDQRRKDDERRRRIDERQVKAFGTVVMAVAAMIFDIDALAGVLLDSLERLKVDPTLMEVWRAKGRIFFRGPSHTGGPAEPGAGGPAAQAEPAKRKRGNGSGGAAAARPEPGEEVALGTPARLGGRGADGTGPDAAAAA